MYLAYNFIVWPKESYWNKEIHPILTNCDESEDLLS